MTSADAPNNLEEFYRTPKKFQQTFLTPLKNLRSFVATIMSMNQKIESGRLTIEQAVFKPKDLIELLARYSLPLRYSSGVSLVAVGKQEVEALLETVFSEWIDFIFVPEPQQFSIYADHDEFTTFFAQTQPELEKLVTALTAKGFEKIPDYQREF